MAFTLANWARNSASNVPGAPAVFTYNGGTDTFDTITASNYFLSEYINLNVGDLIFINGTDLSGFVKVTVVSSASVTVTATQEQAFAKPVKVTWSGSGATLAVTVTGAATTDIVFATIQTAPTQAAYLVSAAVSATNTVTFTLSAANTSNNAVIAYYLVRP